MVLWRKDDLPSYQLVSVLEDRDNGTTDIIRGLDLLPSSLFQSEFYQHFSPQDFSRSFHHALITAEAGHKLSKSQGDQGLREKFKKPHDFFEKVLWPFLGSEYEGLSLEELKAMPPDPRIFKKL